MVILTDLSDVLIHGLYGIEEVLARRYGKDIASKFWQRHLETEEDFHELMRGGMSEDEYWCRLIREGDWPFGIQEIETIFSGNLMKDVPGTLDVYQRITAFPRSLVDSHTIIDGRPEIYIVSDHIEERIDEIYQYHPDIFAMAKKAFWSCEFGNLKRDEIFFLRLLRILDTPLNEIVFIDDNAYNTTAASLVGIPIILFENAKQLEESLKKYGFKFAPSTH